MTRNRGSWNDFARLL